jgi:hypothetical protein
MKHVTTYERPQLEELGSLETLTQVDKTRGIPETEDSITIIWSDDPEA